MNHVPNHYESNKCGYTLVELIVYIGVFSLILITLSTLGTQVMKSSTYSHATIGANQDSVYAQQKLYETLSFLSSVDEPASGTIGSKLRGYDDDNNMVELEIINDRLVLERGSNRYTLTNPTVISSDLQIEYVEESGVITIGYELSILGPQRGSEKIYYQEHVITLRND